MPPLKPYSQTEHRSTLKICKRQYISGALVVQDACYDNNVACSCTSTEDGGDCPLMEDHISEKVAGGVVSRALCVTVILVEE